MIDAERDFLFLRQRIKAPAIDGSQRERLFNEYGKPSVDNLFSGICVRRRRRQHVNYVGDIGGEHLFKRGEHMRRAMPIGQGLRCAPGKITNGGEFNAARAAKRISVPTGNISCAE
jgi:hypothetical protein